MKHPISILAPDPANPRTIAEVAAAGLAVSMAEFGDLAGVVFNKATGELVAGHQRVHELAGAGATHVTFDDDNPGEGWITHPKTGERFAVRIVEWDREKQRVANLVANNPAIGGDWSQDALAQLAALEHDAQFEALQLGALEAQLKEEFARVEADRQAMTGAGSLAEKFLVPPFSVLDARQGYWQDRKRAWLALGIQSELGRTAPIGGGPPARPAATGGGSLQPDDEARNRHAEADRRLPGTGGGKPRREPAAGDEIGRGRKDPTR